MSVVAQQDLTTLLSAAPARAVAVVGLCKNAGKTTVVNAILNAADRTLGLTSLGLDGEAVDHLTGLAKPRIVPPQGTLVATTRGSLERSRASLDVLTELPFRTPLGPVVLGIAPGRTPVEISGPSTLAQLGETVDRLHDLGADRVLIDGAINRLGSASPRVSDGVIMATGAAVGDDLDEAVRVTTDTFDQLASPAVEREVARRLRADTTCGVRLLSLSADGGTTTLTIDSAVGRGAMVARELQELGTETLFVGGALTEDFVSDLVRLLPPGRPLRLVVRDATVLVLPAAWIAKLRRRGVTVEVLDALDVLAVTTNPFRLPRPLDARLFFDAVVEAVRGRAPVFDVVNGLASSGTTATRTLDDPAPPRQEGEE